MTSEERIHDLLDHDQWANKRVLDLALEIGDIPDKAKDLFSHIINAQTIWISRIESIKMAAEPWKPINSSDWNESLHLNSEVLKVISRRGGLDDSFSYQNTKGETFSNAVGDILYQLVMHSQYHRGQIIQLLKPLTDSKLPSTDYIFYKRS
jgi:uncharacterized damage-inducible protein DinB